jgi:hypothetical protein
MSSNEKIQLTLTKSDSQVSNNTQYRLNISILATDPLIQNELLVIRRSSPVEATTPGGASRDEFWGICRYVDISTLGVGEPNSKEHFYLTDEWTLVFGSSLTREEAITMLKLDTTKLAKEVGSFQNPDNSSTVVFEQDY